MPIDHAPRWAQPGLYRLRHFAKQDSMALIILGVGLLFRGLSYAPVILGPPPEAGSHPAETMFPMVLWAAVWSLAGLLCLATAFTTMEVLEATALGLGVALHIVWGTSFIIQSMLIGGRGWVSAIGYFSIAALVVWGVWRGKRGDVEIPPEARGYCR